MVGNVGEDNLLYFYRGQVRSVRISKGERYSGDRFDPPSELVGDETTLSLVSEPRLKGDSVRTAEGAVVGRIERLKSEKN